MDAKWPPENTSRVVTSISGALQPVRQSVDIYGLRRRLHMNHARDDTNVLHHKRDFEKEKRDSL